MPGVLRYVAGTIGAALALGAACATASAAVPEGPQLAVGRWGPKAFSVSLMTVDPAGSRRRALFRAFRRTRPLPAPYGTLAWLPDGSALAFTGLTGSLSGTGPGGVRIFVVDAEGGTPRPVPGTEGGLAPVVSPDGRVIAFARTRERTRVKRRPGEVVERVERSVSTWVVGVEGGVPRRLTPWRYGLEQVPTSFSPDGSVLAVTRTAGRRPPSIVALRLDGGGSRVILRKAASGVFSPDGSRIAYLREGRLYTVREKSGWSTARISDLFVAAADGSGRTRLTRTPRRSEGNPSWDPSGQRLAFLQLGTARAFWKAFGAGSPIVQINADGTCRRKILSLRKAVLFGPSWRPGPDRGAGRIAC
jgi:Tol biopolymer transport system component